jgi:hypothetical protein
MPVYSDDMASAAAKEFACDMAAFWRARLGARLLGVYLIGSLAHGGFNRRYSDIDIALFVEDGLDALVFWLTSQSCRALAATLTSAFALLGGPAFFARPVSPARPCRLSRSCRAANRTRALVADAAFP